MFDVGKARRHAELAAPKEACGLVVAGRYRPCRNSHPEPHNSFQIDPRAYLRLARQGEIQAVVHSHPEGPAEPSALDRRLQVASGVRWCIVLLNDQDVIWFGGAP